MGNSAVLDSRFTPGEKKVLGKLAGRTDDLPGFFGKVRPLTEAYRAELEVVRERYPVPSETPRDRKWRKKAKRAMWEAMEKEKAAEDRYKSRIVNLGFSLKIGKPERAAFRAGWAFAGINLLSFVQGAVAMASTAAFVALWFPAAIHRPVYLWRNIKTVESIGEKTDWGKTLPEKMF